MLFSGGNEWSEAEPAGPPEEDEYVEAALVAANKVYEVQEDSLVPLPDSWGQMPKIEILSSDKVGFSYMCVMFTTSWSIIPYRLENTHI